MAELAGQGPGRSKVKAGDKEIWAHARDGLMDAGTCEEVRVTCLCPPRTSMATHPRQNRQPASVLSHPSAFTTGSGMK